MKKTFIFYQDWIDYMQEMNDEEKINFIDCVSKYNLKQAYAPIWWVKYVRPVVKKQIDKDNQKYEDICERRREYWKQGAEAKKKQNKHKLAKANISKQKIANEAERDFDNDNDSKDILLKEVYVDSNIELYWKTMLDEFFSYRSEEDLKGNPRRKDKKQKYFDVGRRLANWHKRSQPASPPTRISEKDYSNDLPTINL